MEKSLVIGIRVALALALATPLVALGGWRPDSIFPNVVGKALYFRFLVEVALAAWLLLVIRYPTYRLPQSWLLFSLFIYLVIALAASVTGVSLTHSIWSDYERMDGWIGLAHYTAFALMAASVLRSFRHWETLLNVNLLVGLAVGLMGLYEIASGRGDRPGLTFGNPSFMAGYALVNAFLAAGFLARSLAAPNGRGADEATRVNESLMRSFWVAVICLDLLLLSQSGTRGATLGLAVGVFSVLVVGVLWSEQRAIRAVCTAGALGAIVFAIVLAAVRTGPLVTAVGEISPTLSRLGDITPETSAVQSRLIAIRFGMEGFAERPILGWGPENFYAAYDAHVDGVAAARLYRFDRAHNLIVEELVTKGMLGFLAFAGVWGTLGWILLQRIRALPLASKVFAAFILAALVGHFVHNLFLFDTPGSYAQLYLLIGFVLFLAGRPVAATSKEDKDRRIPRAEERSAQKLLGSAAIQAIIACEIVIAQLGVSYMLVARPYLGATGTHSALGGSRTMEERFGNYESAVSSAPWYANEVVNRFSVALKDNWDSLSDEERHHALEIIERDVQDGTRREPTDWQLHLSAAELYNRASRDDPSLTAKSRPHTDRVTDIAPGRFETLQINVQQYILEGKSDEALALIDNYMERSEPYLPKDSAAYRSLEWMRGTASLNR